MPLLGSTWERHLVQGGQLRLVQNLSYVRAMHRLRNCHTNKQPVYPVSTALNLPVSRVERSHSHSQ
jgi:hypothetical protein